MVTQQLNEVIIKWKCWNINNNDLDCCYYIVREYFYDDNNMYMTTVIPKQCYRRLIVNILHGSSGRITEEEGHPCEIFRIS